MIGAARSNFSTLDPTLSEDYSERPSQRTGRSSSGTQGPPADVGLSQRATPGVSTMQRKWTVALAMMLSVSVLAAGMALADDDESPLKQLMEKVNMKTNALKKAVRTQVNFKKAQQKKELAKTTEELIE